MTSDQGSNVGSRENFGFIVVATILMLAFIGIAFLNSDDANRDLELTVKNLSVAALGVPKS